MKAPVLRQARLPGNTWYDVVFSIQGLPIPSKRVRLPFDHAAGTVTVHERQQARVFEATVRHNLRLPAALQWPTGGPVLLALEVVLPGSEFDVKDVDNVAKSVLDALVGIFYKNDSQVVAMYVSKVRGHTHDLTVGVKRLDVGEATWHVPQLRVPRSS